MIFVKNIKPCPLITHTLDSHFNVPSTGVLYVCMTQNRVSKEPENCEILQGAGDLDFESCNLDV